VDEERSETIMFAARRIGDGQDIPKILGIRLFRRGFHGPIYGRHLHGT
jgi:hypothetical protein